MAYLKANKYVLMVDLIDEIDLKPRWQWKNTETK